MTDEEAIRTAVDGELRLLDPVVRARPDQVAALLDPEFTEVGASGRTWDRESIMTLMGPAAGQGPRTVPHEVAGRVVAPGVILVSYRTESGGFRARRSSIWRLREGRWLLYYHQGTPEPGTA
ncbi:DUF4440 domain-containing protein [Nonomuraea sp. NPDC050328]|uniref:nuclear transport factor 2 family protein n=1 Tax=Nonomuraea sp. NPDC050328 TaxID=3364361 RepID=UPI00378AC05D